MSLSPSPRPSLPAPHDPHSRPRITLWSGVALAGFAVAQPGFAGGALPQGGHYVAGSGGIASQGNSLVVTQPGSTRGVIDWHSFSIGNGNTVTFNNGSGATLNRVSGCAPSTILGTLTATGDVYLINPQGIVIGRSGVVSTGGRFLASTLDVPDTAFINGGTLTFAGTSTGDVVNLGRISSSGGDVFLISRNVVLNRGSVDAPNGTAEYAVGQQVVLADWASGRQILVQTGSKGSVIDSGATQAAQIALAAADGNIYALAGNGSRIRATGTATRDGHIWLVADEGRVTQQGTVTATNRDGSGGTVDTLAASLSFAHDAAVKAGLWNVSTPAFTIDRAASRALMRSLNAGTSVDASATGTNGASGDLTVASNLSWNGSASLVLAAAHNVAIAAGATVRNTGSGNLSLRADAAGIDNNGSVTNQGSIDWSGSTGIVSAFYDMNGSYSPGTIVANSAWTAAPYSGLVTQVTAYKLVNSVTDLQNVALDLSGAYALGRDLDAGAASPSGPFASLGNADTPFSGQFDGMGHVIDRFTQFDQSTQTSTTPAYGLFGVIGPSGVVRNVGMTNATVGTNSYYPQGLPLGILAGQNQGLITYAYTSGGRFSASFEGAYLGGLVGRNDGLIERSSSSASVGSAGLLGGLVGANFGTIAQSYSTGPVSAGNHGDAGALVGHNGGTISQSYATGVSYGGLSTGGIAFTNAGTIEQSFAAGLVQGYCCSPPDTPTSFGGIAGYNAPEGNAGIASNVYWDKDTTTRSVSAGTGPQLPASNGLTTAQMSDPASFVGWDFGPGGVWTMPAGATHPVLSWQQSH
ncbi:filamentous hemagglutinin N-terminal domain-containing protein [Paraburkholderia sp. MMS20-SJTR3]|uniref:Filamentous hemagglutinin N-terminal domain-containing protein n=1 Tax=Paraburkholderia sejongensis TaxID=2886946 RepID=A0ABS8K060_9BURK|nr:filamentous hemagglutinin N-terminal domain-containing protein [Paraburkholderia sp. MMS20-SJTR3]MCC8395547.1 filamentous hemagglutinin N-terminal domain-containing protein [Paraburkholderia sp. MMS20-SJTR3]